jgi:hypothetical protein
MGDRPRVLRSIELGRNRHQLRLKSRRQQAHRLANAVFEAERQRIAAAYASAVEAARNAFDAVKHDPTHPDHDAARAEYERLRSLPPSYRTAHDALDTAIHAADAAFAAELDRIGAEHGVSVR